MRSEERRQVDDMREELPKALLEISGKSSGYIGFLSYFLKRNKN